MRCARRCASRLYRRWTRRSNGCCFPRRRWASPTICRCLTADERRETDDGRRRMADRRWSTDRSTIRPRPIARTEPHMPRRAPKVRVSALPLASPSQYTRRRSACHGLGVFAVKPIAAGTRIIEYAGELISHAEGERRYPTAPDGHEEPEHTYLLQLDDDRVIDANVGGNDARLINHSCAPNCE